MTTRTEKRRAVAQTQRASILEKIRPEMMRLSQELHGGQYAPNQAEFALFAVDMPDRTKLNMVFGQWRNAVADCGLTLAEPKYYYEKRRERETTALWHSKTTYPVRDDELLAAEYVGLGFRATRSYEAVYSRAGRTYSEKRYILR
ncbi:MAG: hypothetical protein DDT21_02306 [Syntrophomonadaceae bacterium]|nr:hypothetical protein [Bacillota bacterium]